MTTAVAAPAPVAVPRPTRRYDAVIGAVFTVLAVVVLQNQWKHLHSGYLKFSGQDQTMWEWFFAVTARSVSTLQNPFFSDLQNAPDGVNMMANTAMLGLSVPLTPITLAFGPTATFVTALTVGLATTAFGWYYLFSRTVIRSPLAAALGGLICGFAPGMISHANAHPNFTVLGVLPFILLLVLRIAQRDRVRRNTIVLSLLAAWQVLLGEEPLLIFAVAVALFVAFHAVIRPRRTATMVRWSALPLSVAGVVSLVLVSVPLWWQFRGAQSYQHLDHNLPGNDITSLVAYPPQSLWGKFFPGEDLALNPTEQNAYFGVGFLVLALIAALILWRHAVAVAATLTVLVLAVLSLGSDLMIGDEATGIRLPGAHLDDLPLLQSVLDTRFVLAAVPPMALLIAMVTDRVLARRRRAQTVGWAAAVAVAVIPLVPLPLPVAPTPETPEFLASGAWRDHVDDGSIVSLPLPSPGNASALRWQVETGLQYRIAGGYFVGPSGKPDGEAKYGTIDRSTAILLGTVASTGIVPTLSDDQRAAAREDVRFWEADVVMVPDVKNQEQLRDTVTDLLSADPVEIDGTYVWDVRE